ncbi:uncharacterized protein A4U43_C08F33600 [Asparagus officinalis]|nr:uncharacterized protein A4U43_C08F33600 [Asparagus officinalis]
MLNGMRTVVAMAETGVNRRLICTCLKSMASRVSGATVELVGGLPAKRGVAVAPFETSPKTDCDNVFGVQAAGCSDELEQRNEDEPY